MVIDLAFDGKMVDAEVRSLCSQLMYSYGANKRAAQPCQLHLTSLTVRCCAANRAPRRHEQHYARCFQDVSVLSMHQRRHVHCGASVRPMSAHESDHKMQGSNPCMNGSWQKQQLRQGSAMSIACRSAQES